jgi:23S rRNA pseudouridine2604 synthase
MGFYRRVKYFLVHTLKLSNKEAQELIDSGAVKTNGVTITENCTITDDSEIQVNDKIIRTKKEFVYILFYKPTGFESTLNTRVEKNLSPFFKDYPDLAIAGRLDKQSEGLLLLSNDGKWIENLCNPKYDKEKEYIVTVDKNISDSFIEKFVNGVEIDGFVTKKCICEKIDQTTLRIILTEGKNRQIRKMCMVLGYNVLTLKRTRISTFFLSTLEEGNFMFTKI